LGYKVEGGVWSKEGKPLKLTVLVWKQFERIAQIADQQLRKANFNVEFQSLAMTTLDAKVTAWDFDLAFSGHGGIGGDPVLFDAAVKADSLNSARFRHPELDRLIAEQIREMDPVKRKEKVDRLQLLYADLLPAISLYYPTNVFADSGKVPLFYTLGGIGRGVPNFQNKISFITGLMP
jgi:peptide/nickel transport system substrate-binding protein